MNWNDLTTAQKINFKNSLEAIKKINNELGKYPHNKQLFVELVRGILTDKTIKNFEVKKIYRENLSYIKEEYHLREKIRREERNISYFFGYKSYLTGNVCLTDTFEHLLDDHSDYSCFLGMDFENVLILFVVDKKEILSKEERKVFDEFFGN